MIFVVVEPEPFAAGVEVCDADVSLILPLTLKSSSVDKENRKRGISYSRDFILVFCLLFHQLHLFHFVKVELRYFTMRRTRTSLSYSTNSQAQIRFLSVAPHFHQAGAIFTLCTRPIDRRLSVIFSAITAKFSSYFSPAKRLHASIGQAIRCVSNAQPQVQVH